MGPENYQSTLKKLTLDELANKLKRWLDNPKSEPDIEQWYQDGCPLLHPKTNQEIDFQVYFPVYERARKEERAGNVDAALIAYLSILKQYRPTGLDYYTRPAIILEKQKNYKDAIKVCKKALGNMDIMTPPTAQAAIVEFNKRIERLNKKIGRLDKVTTQKTNNNIESKMPVEVRSLDRIKGWHVSISFGKSTSKNFSRALAMAKSSPQYIESFDEANNPIYQAIYGPTEYLEFIALYELISQWKSTFAFMNGEMVDRKIVGNINYCYGDKLRSGKSDFCYGASQFTENPFGCHRAQMHRYNDPWHSFGIMDTAGVFHVDIEKIISELRNRLIPYKHCPALNMNDILDRATRLPRTINPRKQSDWEYVTDYYAGEDHPRGVQPKGSSPSCEIRLTLGGVQDGNEPSRNTESTPVGILPKLLSRLFKK